MFTNRALIGLFCFGLSVPVVAAERGQSQSQSSGNPDFLFGQPWGYVGIQGGWSFASASGEIFDFVTEQLTVDKGDFNAPALLIDFAIDIHPHLAAAFRFEYSKATIESEFREWVDQDDDPIVQTTHYSKIPLTANLKVYLRPRGREISRFAWVPYSVAPYVGGGGGLLWYRFEQFGDFVDFDDLGIFSDTFRSDGWAPTFNFFGGVDVKLHKRFFLSVEVRYAWAESDLGQDFVDFEPINLAGLSTSAGVNILF
jgi:hypothetical protein